MRQQPYEISDNDICYGWNCVFILHFLVCCNHMWTSLNGEARTKQIHKHSCECCLRLSQLNGEPRKTSGVESCVAIQYTRTPLTVTLDHSKVLPCNCLRATNLDFFFHQSILCCWKWKSSFVASILCHFGLINTNLATPLNIHDRDRGHSESILFIFSQDWTPVPVIRTIYPEKLAILADSTGRWSYKHVRKSISRAQEGRGTGREDID